MNVGLHTFSISEVRVDDYTKPVLATGGSLTGSGPYDLDPGESGTITISLSWTSGIPYIFEVITTGLNYEPPYPTQRLNQDARARETITVSVHGKKFLTKYVKNFSLSTS